eukprot:752943-Rhodomonas_salina.2
MRRGGAEEKGRRERERGGKRKRRRGATHSRWTERRKGGVEVEGERADLVGEAAGSAGPEEPHSRGPAREGGARDRVALQQR